MKLTTFSHAFDRSDLATFSVQAQKQTGQDRTPVDQHRARAALSQFTAVLRSGQRKVFAQDFEQGFVRRKGHFGRFAVKRERNVLLLFGHVGHCLVEIVSSSTSQGAVLRAPTSRRPWFPVRISISSLLIR